MKKVVALLLVAVMALSVLAGCDKKEDTPSTPSTTDAPASNSNDSATPVKISLYRASFNTQTPDSAQEKKIRDKPNAYLKEKGFNIEIDYHDIGSDEYTDKANLALANNEINLLWTASWESVIGTNDLIPKTSCRQQALQLYGCRPVGSYQVQRKELFRSRLQG